MYLPNAAIINHGRLLSKNK